MKAIDEMRLTHLTATGSDVPPSTVEFGAGLTVIHGASDTGKTYIAQAIDFVLGASKLKQIREAEHYTRLLLGVALTDDQYVTLVRPTPESAAIDQVAIYPGRHHSVPAAMPEAYLSPKHNRRNTLNISRYLLTQVGLDGKLVRRNARNETRLLSFRDLAGLCIIHETEMQSETSPVLSGQYVNETTEKSVFKLMVDGRDDGDIKRQQTTPDERKVSKGKAELIDQLIEELRRVAEGSQELRELQLQHGRVLASIDRLSESVGTAVGERDRLLRARDEAQARLSADRSRLAEIGELLARFTLLREQYDSDLARLDMVQEVGDLLGYFDRGVCVFCGADVDDQHPPAGHVISEITELAEAVNAERAKTIELRDDLDITMADVAGQRGQYEGSLGRNVGNYRQLDSALAAAERDLSPRNEEFSGLLAIRSSLERQIAAHQQIESLELRRGGLNVDGERQLPPGRNVSTTELADLGAAVANLLHAWGVAEAARVDFDLDTYDLIVDGRPRSGRGKGVRAVFHAGFTLGLALHCRAAGLPHPGFVVLDSPLITYRGPAAAAPVASDEEFVTQTVAEAFFRYLASGSTGQVIVLENTDPPSEVDGIAALYFSGSRDVGRYGYLPAIAYTGQLF
jgi:hypothetical protein